MNNSLRFDVFDFEEARTTNGVPVYVKNLPWIPGWLEIRIMIRVGARHDPVGKEGLAHFFEHFPFQGCEGFPDYLAIKEVKERLFYGNLNANTNMERTCFKATVFKQDLPEAIEFFRKFIFHPLFVEEAIEKERSVIIREIWDSLKNQKIADFAKASAAMLYLSDHHPVGRMFKASGWEESVRTITREDLIDFHRKYYHLPNLSLLFVGDVTLFEALNAAELFCRQLPIGTPTEPAVLEFKSWPPPRQPSYITTCDKIGVPTSGEIAAFTVERLLGRFHKKRLLSIMNLMISRELNLQIREELGAMYGAKIELSRFSDHLSWRITITTDPQKAEACKAIVLSTLDAIMCGRKQLEFEQAKQNRSMNVLLIDENVNDIADSAVNHLAIDGRIISLQERLDHITAVTYEDICDFMKRELEPEKLLWLEVYP